MAHRMHTHLYRSSRSLAESTCVRASERAHSSTNRCSMPNCACMWVSMSRSDWPNAPYINMCASTDMFIANLCSLCIMCPENFPWSDLSSPSRSLSPIGSQASPPWWPSENSTLHREFLSYIQMFSKPLLVLLTCSKSCVYFWEAKCAFSIISA